MVEDLDIALSFPGSPPCCRSSPLPSAIWGVRGARPLYLTLRRPLVAVGSSRVLTLGWQPIAASDLGFAGLAVLQGAAFVREQGSRGPMNAAVHCRDEMSCRVPRIPEGSGMTPQPQETPRHWPTWHHKVLSKAALVTPCFTSRETEVPRSCSEPWSDRQGARLARPLASLSGPRSPEVTEI